MQRLVFNCASDSQHLIEACRSVSRRATQTLGWHVGGNAFLLDIGLDHLTLARAALCEAVLRGEPPAGAHMNEAVEYLRRAGQQDYLPLGLLTRTLWRAASGDFGGAREDLDEALEIAERGPMRLHLANIHLHRARLFGLIANRPAAYPWVSPRDDLDEARKLIEDCGYGRRREELEDAEAAWERLYGRPRLARRIEPEDIFCLDQRRHRERQRSDPGDRRAAEAALDRRVPLAALGVLAMTDV